MSPNVGDRLLARFHAFDEVRRMVLAHLTAIDLFDRPFGQRLLLSFSIGLPVISLDSRRIDLRPFEENSIITFAGNDHFNILRHVNLDFEVGRCVVLVMHDRVTIFVFHGKLEFYRSTLLGPVSLAPMAQHAMSTWCAPQSVSFPPEYSCQFRNA